MFPHAFLDLKRMFIRAGGISLISETAQLLETTAALSSGASNNGWQMPTMFKGADAAVDFWRLLSIVAQTSLISGLSTGGLSNKGGADRLSTTVALLMVDLVTILLFSGASLWDPDGISGFSGFLCVFAHRE
ncbi:hypothetical protein T03_13558 [Trichinella britovi]|uniref:Uncharacterized protein n=1 Tax=Trichinella britovi TaxID=45882 RepID=A0A0V1C7I7_TRIBR|nr:hypothetical protein T03_13558 [Trichinella britovi]